MEKKHLILILAALATLSCAKVEVAENPAPDEAVDFSWYTRRGTAYTKANSSFVGEGSTHLPDASSFGVFGYFHPQLSSSTPGTWDDGVNQNYPNLFYNEEVTISESSGTYIYDYVNSRFWPKNKLDRISFLAYYPYQNTINSDGTPNPEAVVEPVLDKSYSHDGLVSFNYQVKPQSKDHVDFMVSDMALNQSKAIWNDDNSKGLTGTANGKVKCFFHHALSLVRVKDVKFDTSTNPDVEVSVEGIKFNGIYVYGNCQPVPDLSSTNSNTGRTPVSETWSNLLPIRPGESSPTGVSASPCYDAGTDTWDSEGFLLMIPHTAFPAGATISVTFSLTRKKDDKTGEYYTYSGNVLSANLATPAVSSWEAGKIYTYNITLNLRSISFTADVEDWLVAGEDVFMEETT